MYLHANYEQFTINQGNFNYVSDQNIIKFGWNLGNFTFLYSLKAKWEQKITISCLMVQQIVEIMENQLKLAICQKGPVLGQFAEIFKMP